MTWDALPPEIRRAAKARCSAEEYDVLRLAAHGYGRRAGARALGITEDAWRWRYDSACRKIREEVGDDVLLGWGIGS